MSNGAILQLESKNEFDELLFTDDIKMSEFKNTYKKITNFSEVPYSFYPTGAVSWGDRMVFKINKVGDLMTNMYIAIELPEINVTQIIGKTENIVSSNYRVKWQDYIGYTIIEKATLRIGGQIIQEMTGEYMMCYTDLYDNAWITSAMCGHDVNLISPQLQTFKQYIYVPLRFFNCGNYNSALPINALRYHEIEVEIKLRRWDEVYLVLQQLTDIKNADATKNDPASGKYSHTLEKLPQQSFNNIRLDCNFIFLESNEREYYLNNKLEILITQVQMVEQTCANQDTIFLNFTNPIREFYFLLSKPEYNKESFCYSGKPQFIPYKAAPPNPPEFTKTLWNQIPEKDLLLEASLQFNNVDRVPYKDYKYWFNVQNYETFKSRPLHLIYLYSFGLSNKKMNCGSCNFSEFENVKLNIRLAGSDIRQYHILDDSYTIELGPEISAGTSTRIVVFGINYNILQIEDGMAQLQFGM
jgi:hypothetical protein